MIKRKKTIGILFVVIGCLALYIFGYKDSLSKVDAFCGEIDASIKPSDVTQLAEKFGLKLLGTKNESSAGLHHAYVASAYTMGEYRCGIEATMDTMVRKSMPDGTTIELNSALDVDAI